jgi:hypothetical protein
MIAKASRLRIVLAMITLLVLGTVGLTWQSRSAAQSLQPILFSREDSTRAIAVDSVTNTREPFAAIAPVAFGVDHSTRVMLFAGSLRLQAGEAFNVVTADAEDESHHI